MVAAVLWLAALCAVRLSAGLLVLDWQQDSAVVVVIALLVTAFYCTGRACVTAEGGWRLLAVALVALQTAALAWVIMGTGSPGPPPSRQHETRVRLNNLRTALQAYRLDYGHYPAGDEPAVTAALTATASNAVNPRGKRFLWIDGYREMPGVDSRGSYLDAWQHPIRLEWAGDRESVLLRSVGKDGIANTRDDVTVETGRYGESEPGGGG